VPFGRSPSIRESTSVEGFREYHICHLSRCALHAIARWPAEDCAGSFRSMRSRQAIDIESQTQSSSHMDYIVQVYLKLLRNLPISNSC
jgi:hypothetical protein